MTPDEKIKKILSENKDIWKTESAYFSYLRGCIRLAWNKNPVKLKLLKKIKKQIPNPNYGKPRNTKPIVFGGTCEICKDDFPMKFLEVDHKDGGVYSLKKVGKSSVLFVKMILGLSARIVIRVYLIVQRKVVLLKKQEFRKNLLR